MAEDWCCEKLKDLKIKDRRLDTLTEIRLRLNESNSLQNITTRLLNSPEIYECLESSNSEDQQFELASDILSICMSNVSISDNNFNRTPAALQRALNEHRKPEIRALALNAILKEVQRYSNPYDFKLPQETLMLIINSLEHQETKVSGPAVAILSLVLLDKLELRVIREELTNMLSKNETIKCRVYELAVNLAKFSAGTLEKVQFLLDRAITELTSDNDVLVQMNIMEVLVQLAEQNHGLMYLERQMVFEAFSARISDLEQNPIDRLLVPGIMKFFGKTASLQPQKIITGYPHMIQCLFECIRSGDINVLPVAFDTFANIAFTSQGKLLLEANYSAFLPGIFEEYASYLRNLSSDLKNRAFNSLQLVFTAQNTQSVEVSDVLRKWFTYLSDSPNMQFLMDFCRNPFPDIKVACLCFIKAVCSFKWGIEALKNTAGFLEYLLDRKIEFDKEAKYVKFELIKLLSEADMFDVQTQLKLSSYVNKGPYYVEAIMDIAVEGDS